MYLYIANVTHQRHVVFYRLDFIQEGNAALRANNVKNVAIEPGRQVPVGGDLTPDQAQLIMDQLQPYGGVGVEELNRVPPGRISYLLSYGKEIPAKLIHMANEHNRWILTGEGDTRRRNAAIAAHPEVERQIDTLKKLDIEMLEEPPQPGDPDPLGKRVDFGAHIDPSGREAGKEPPPTPSPLAKALRRGRGKKG